MFWYILGIVLFALGIGVSVALHEFGHLLTAKAFGMKVTRYFIGFGPKLFSFRRGETEYGFKVIPLGGFCEIVGMTGLDEVPAEDAPRAFYRQRVWKRVVVLAAGAFTQFILGFVVLYLAAMTTGLPNDKAIVSQAADCVARTQDVNTGEYAPCTPGTDPAPAKAAGIQEGDQIVAVAGKTTPTYVDVQAELSTHRGQTEVTVLRDGEQRTLTVDVAAVERRTRAADGKIVLAETGALGVQFPTQLTYNGLTAVPASVRFTGMMFENTWQGLLRLPEKLPAVVSAIMGEERDPNSPVSVVGATRIGGEAAEQGIWWLFLLLLASLNFFMGVFNLLPLLPMDGGHIAVNVYERVRDWLRRLRGKPAGGPVDYTKLLPLTYVMVFLGGAMVLLTVTADIINPIRLPS
ncbi:M50 family metallopeptidase [Goodfellowiella coeruleoviolacea]|uniref:RIP metalloprotease RseP n=1 Tax=Goodfellowiella coeruleoviolacea TaxID=334858 RepID=A0AAE3GBU5_9PSEU|nr:site-2 protease family protein [Goodfellowiella coeruleoviolacea]MCP2165416.1 RIP metalloprotease RseP [Goodfellowiella coeruleoviolacea]